MALASQRSAAVISEIKAASAMSPASRRKGKSPSATPPTAIPTATVEAVMNQKTQVVSRHQRKELASVLQMRFARGKKGGKGDEGTGAEADA